MTQAGFQLDLTYGGDVEAFWQHIKKFSALGKKSASKSIMFEAKRLSNLFKAELKAGGKKTGFAPTSGFTRAVRKAYGRNSRKPLMDTGLFYKMQGHGIFEDGYYAGLKPLVDYIDPDTGKVVKAATLAFFMENGIPIRTIPLDEKINTDKTFRNWLSWLLFRRVINWSPRAGTTSITFKATPPRPYFSNVMGREADLVGANIFSDFEKRMTKKIIRKGTKRTSNPWEFR